MANQITIDIVAQTQKLTSGINDANTQIDGMSSKLKGAAAAAGLAASAFVAKQGITFLKQGIDEAKEAQQTMREATTTFGEGSAALAKITADAEKFGKAIAVDNDEIIKLATQLGSRLPADSKALSAELINTAKDIEAYTAGALSAEAVSSKLAKAFTDGELSAKELTKIFPDLSDATYEQAEALSKAGKNQEALTLLNDAAQKKYGDAAEKNVTATQKFDKALADLKETVGSKVLPIVEKFINALTFVLEKFSALPGPVQNAVIAFVAVVGVTGTLLTLFASMKTSLITLGIVKAADAAASGAQTAALGAQTTATTAATGAQRAFNLTMLANPIGIVIAAIVAIIAVIVLLVKNWDTVTEVVGKAWDKIKEFASGAWEALKGFAKKVAEFAQDVIEVFTFIPRKMFELGKNIVSGLWDGIQNMASWLKNKVFDFFGNLIPSWAKKMLGISSPSKVFAAFGENIVQGLAQGINAAENIAKNATLSLGNTTVGGLNIPSLSNTKSSAGINITINAGLGTNGPALGRQVSSAIKQYGKVSSQVAFGAR